MPRLIESDPCFVKALPDEPAFVLLARDPAAPAWVAQWAAFRRIEIHSGARPLSDLPQVEAAERIAHDMRTWRADADGAWRIQPGLPFPPVSDGRTFETFGAHFTAEGHRLLGENFAHELACYGMSVTQNGEHVPLQDFLPNPLAGQHLARREQDEYVCTRCAKRWAVDEDAPEACA